MLSVFNVPDKKFFDMGWCYRPVSAVTSDLKFDCLDIRFYFSANEIQDKSKPGYTNKYIGYDLFAPELDIAHMLPIDLVHQSLDSNILATSTDQTGSWTINTDKSYKECSLASNSDIDIKYNCLFSANFFR